MSRFLLKRPVDRSTLRQIALVLLAVVLVTGAHLVTPHSYVFIHSALQHLYYLPIVLGAVFFGWPGGLLTAACVAMCYMPHIHDWRDLDANYALNQYAELGSFFLIGFVTGVLADRERGRALQLEEKSAELEQANHELEESFERVKRADRLSAVGQLAAGMAHEIRHPLASIEGAVHVLANPESPPDLQDEFRGIIKRETRRLTGLVTELLDFARPRAPKFRMVDLNALIPEVVALERSSSGASNVEIRTDLPMELPTIECDEEQIKQVMLNLVMNAGQAMPEGGEVVISARRQGHEIALVVSDNGPGVPDDLAGQIFDPFFTTRESGTGLGLSVAQQIATQHGGSLEVGKNVGQGARFTLRLPIRREAKQ